jgi:hypothetical protein
MTTLKNICGAYTLVLATLAPAFAGAEPAEPPPSLYERGTDPIDLEPNEVAQIPVTGSKIRYYNLVSGQNVDPKRLYEMDTVLIKYPSASSNAGSAAVLWYVVVSSRFHPPDWRIMSLNGIAVV